jgi:hypothetical protein
MMSKLDFSAIPGHVERESAPQAIATPVLDFSAIPGHIQHSDGAVPEATMLGKVTKDAQTILRQDVEATGREPATVTWESLHPVEE